MKPTFKRWLTGALGALFFAQVVTAAEINDLSTRAGPAAPDYTNQPLGLPEFVWWAMAVLAVSATIGFFARYWTWLRERLYEPSTYLAAAVFLACGGLFLDSLVLDPNPKAQGLLLAAAVFAFLGLIGKDREGPLL